jgi:hypothetical protein
MIADLTDMHLIYHYKLLRLFCVHVKNIKQLDISNVTNFLEEKGFSFYQDLEHALSWVKLHRSIVSETIVANVFKHDNMHSIFMAKSQSKKSNVEAATTEPKFPYTVVPNTLRRFLEIVPKRPKPPKVVTATLRTWDFKGGNDPGILSVLKKIGLLTPSNEPTQAYADYMKSGTGAAALGVKVKECYETLFQNVANPEKASNDDLRNFFNIHSGGGERTIHYQIETFKAIAAFSTFGVADPLAAGESIEGGDAGAGYGGISIPPIRIDLHIHLPENKSKADYDAIMESIANHLYRQKK